MFIQWTFILASCRANSTIQEGCGDGNGCYGSVSSYVCDCSARGWKDGDNSQECIQRKFSFRVSNDF